MAVKIRGPYVLYHANNRLQPPLHDLVGTVMAPTSALSGADGQIRAEGVQGLFHADSRALSRATLTVDGLEPEAVGHAFQAAGRTRFVSVARWLGDPISDPTVRLDRTREVAPGRMTESVEIASTATRPVTATVAVELSCDFAPLEVVRQGGPADPGAGVPSVVPSVGEGTIEWRSGPIRVRVESEGATASPADDAPAASGDAAGGRLRWEVALAPRERVTLRWSVVIDDPEAVVAAPSGTLEWSVPQVTADDARLVRLAAHSLEDLRSLRLAESTDPGQTFLGAGVPWYLTLFGRDSLWAARMMLPLGTGLAAGTLRVLARRQGSRLDPASGEAPGKIMHELRRNERVGRDLRLPAAYYGTIDATPLWVGLLHDAWRWGMPAAQVEPLLPALESALRWLGEHADPDGDGFLEYIDTSGHGLANQGWKDSGDAVRFHDGRQAEPPIALAEVQGYACAAARQGADLLEAFGREGAEKWRAYAEAMGERFRTRFWTGGTTAPTRTSASTGTALAGNPVPGAALSSFPALALDRDKRPVDSLTSNIGHLIGTGLLSEAEEARVTELLAAPAMSGAYGLRTMSADDGAFSPLSYHCGSVWAHDTAIVIAALARAGHGAPAGHLAQGLLAAAEGFGYRLPELYAGDDRDEVGRPVAYPAACRPQAWSAAAAVTLLHAAAGLYPDVPGGKVLLRPLAGAPLGAVTVRGLRVAGAEVTVTVSRSGAAEVTGLPPGLSIETAES
ncbi:amylo-alpha-1,6-glucosidase [Nonomuraea rhizosphaerae]|uniref:amylo-alpha-1,6-glucosidase n=1 Tax=Nonomuraea rhizosphaerae TaxID=2665663 RepID=UPI0027E33C67|nr:glycogen debranching N-terminal domain-containing protein [Nonomuraea rhizosphaerae]